ncbi:T9SS sorting signal type C domain-containing protein [Flavobacterium pectinovorum]|uniref:T9SS C-terminal target domain-containing protein n=1 Tax=Flavobacterium pectinovorum TaxID=29533 RepID=A0A502EIW5_9FLAO|nr:T9SS sorting signal type C domain-containing protein [Flavobacterium pectinovorum]TPG36271.1 T9SS C-terminal target domain-containing protein [Flavobacterium pectinovorum]
MSHKSLLPNHTFFISKIVLLFLLISFKMSSQTKITTIYTDWNGYWKSNGLTGVGNRPDTENNLLAFEWNNKTYSTGVNDAILNGKPITYSPQKFRALKIQTLGLDPANMYFLQGSKIDGDDAITKLIPPLAGATSTGAELASRLTDGINGLTLGTGIANIKAGSAEFKVGTNNLNINGLGDNIPDLIVTQVADPGGTADVFKFVDKDNNVVGHALSTNFGSMSAIGTYSLDLFRADNAARAFTPAATRDIRMLAIETSEFGITAANAASVDRFVITFSGSSDCAFIAFNTNSLKIPELTLVTKGTLNSCGKVGDKINYTFEVTNTGEVPITDIKVTDALTGITISGNPIASLAVGAKTTLTGVYTITAADVAAGKIINTGKVTGVDPSLNTVEFNNTPAAIFLLTPPTISAFTNTTCTTLGTITLTDLPPSGNWTVERTPGAVKTVGTGISITLTGIPVGKYTYKVYNTCFMSPSSAEVTITNQSSTTWDGTAWSTGDPNATKSAVFAGPFTITADIEACSCTINSGVNIIVPAGRTLNIKNALNVVSGGSLTFQNNSSLLQTNGTSNLNTGNIIYQRNTDLVRRYDFTYWSTPITNTAQPYTLHKLSPDTLLDKYNSYNSQASAWDISLNGTRVMVPAVGYTVRAPQTFSLTNAVVYPAVFTGVPNNGDYSVQIYATKWSLIGNPYPSAIDADKFININHLASPSVDVGALYFWTHNSPPSGTPSAGGTYDYTSNDYAVYTLSGSTATGAKLPDGSHEDPPSGKIAACQSFFMKASGPGSVKFTNDMRISGSNNQFFKTTNSKELEKNRLWLNLTNAKGAFKQALISYIEGATNTWDINYDATTMNGNSFIDLYSINDSQKLSIQGRALPFEDSDRIPLGYKTTVAGDFTIAIDHADGLFDNQAIYLEDKTTGTVTDLRAANYTFTTAIGTFVDRFTIAYTKKTLGTGDFESTQDDVLISIKDKIIKVTATTETIKEVTIYDISGKLLYNKKKIGVAELQIPNLQSSNQVLLVKVTLDNNYVVTKKIIFQ